VKRWAPPLIRICVFLLLGAFVNVAVAWGCARMAPRISNAGRLLSLAEQNSLWDRYAADTWTRNDIEDLRGAQWPGLAVSYLEVSSGGFDVDSQQRVWKKSFPRVGVQIERAGFPFHVVESGEAVSIAGMIQQARSGAEFPTSWRLLAVGFAINTLFYAALLWLLFAAPFALRRRRRIKRGLCPACAYPVGDSDVCTECGKPVTPPARCRA
jgi:hypothetical protein